MHSKGFTVGFAKTAGIVGKVAKGALKALGGPIGAPLTALSAGMEGKGYLNKMTAAAAR